MRTSWSAFCDIGSSCGALLSSLFAAAGSLLFGVAPTDYRVIVLAAAVMLFVAAGAGLLPARRAARMDPIKALRTE